MNVQETGAVIFHIFGGCYDKLAWFFHLEYLRSVILELHTPPNEINVME